MVSSFVEKKRVVNPTRTDVVDHSPTQKNSKASPSYPNYACHEGSIKTLGSIWTAFLFSRHATRILRGFCLPKWDGSSTKRVAHSHHHHPVTGPQTSTLSAQLRMLVTQALALLTAASALSGSPADELIEKCGIVMQEYRGTLVAAAEVALAAALEARGAAAPEAGDAVVSAPTHGGVGEGGVGDKVDVFTTLR